MQVKTIAECSKWSSLQYIRLSLRYQLLLRSLFCLFLSGRFTQVLLYIKDMNIKIQPSLTIHKYLTELTDTKSGMDKKGLLVNMGKTKILVSGTTLDLLKKSGKESYVVCITGMNRNVIFSGGTQKMQQY